MEQDQNSTSNEGASYFHRIKKKKLVRSYPTLISDTALFFFKSLPGSVPKAFVRRSVSLEEYHQERLTTPYSCHRPIYFSLNLPPLNKLPVSGVMGSLRI